MSLLFVGPRGGFEVRWVTYALLRDGVLHLERRAGPDPGLEPLLRISEALGGRSVRLSALGLRLAVLAARSALGELPREAVALSPETAAVIAGTSPETGELIAERVASDAAVRTFGELIASIVEPLLSVTEGATENDVVEVNDL